MTGDTHASAMLILGAWHGVNPAMGWLFAVALGLQERRRAAVWRALPPLALGHAAAVAGALALAALLGRVVPISTVKWVVAIALFAFGVFRLARQWHPRIGSMRVGAVGLTVWSALVASAHGAGLMILPFGRDLSAAALHTASYLVATGILAVIVYEKLGLRLLGRAWVNVDLVWAAALIVTALFTPFL
jgi:hypothetical protein